MIRDPFGVKESMEPPIRFVVVARAHPPPRETANHIGSAVKLIVLNKPLQRNLQVGALGTQQRSRLRLLCGAHRCHGQVGFSRIVVGVKLGGDIGISALCKQCFSELANRFEKSVSDRAGRRGVEQR